MKEQLDIENIRICPATGQHCYSSLGCLVCGKYAIPQEELEENKKDNGGYYND